MKSREWLLVGLVAVLALGISSAWQRYCAPRIAEAEEQQQARTWLSVLPTERYDNQPLQQPLPLPDPELAHSRVQAAYLATLRGQPSAVVLHSRFQGYAGPIDLLLAIDREGRLIASRVLQQQETPGLGARLAEPGGAWLHGFDGRSQGNTPEGAWALKRDNGQFDQLAGASITSRAVIQAIQDALRYFDGHAQRWLKGDGAHE
ncbi:RnfABCDGE type electron transport complex subunit G [Pseudomonas wadenswilerensis]